MKRHTWRTIVLLVLTLFVVLTIAGTETMADTVTIEQTVLLDQNGIKITAKSIDMSGLLGPEVKMLFENNSDKSVTIQVRNASINGYMVDPTMSVDITPGNKANSQMRIMKAELERAGITTIADIEFSFHVFDSSSWDTIFDSDMVRIETSVANTYQYTFDSTGDQVFHDNNIDIVIKGLAEKDSVLGKQIIVYIANESDTNITVQARNMSVNGFMIDPIFSCDVVVGKHAVDTIILPKKNLEENEIQTIETVTLSFHIYDAITWKTIVDSPMVTWQNSHEP